MSTSKESISEILIVLAAAYPRFTLTKDTMTAYIAMLKDMDPETLKAAAFQCASNSSFFPSVFEIRQAAAEIQRKAENIPTAYEAWDDLNNAGNGYRKMAILKADGYESHYEIETKEYEWLHPLVKRVAEQLGWPRNFPGDNLSTDRAHYFKAYEQELSNYLNDRRMLPEVRGYIESLQSKQLEAENDRSTVLEEIKRLADQKTVSGDC
jgi:hypothetical protein